MTNIIETAYQILKANKVKQSVVIKVTGTAKGLKVSMGNGQPGIQFNHFDLEDAVKFAARKRSQDLMNMAHNIEAEDPTSRFIEAYRNEARAMLELSNY